MIITTTPLTLRLIGDATTAVTTTMNRYYRIVINRPAPPWKGRFLIRHHVVEDVREISDIRHPLIRECLRYLRVRDGLDLTVIPDLPQHENLSSLAVALLHALHAAREDEVNAEELAREALIVLQNCGYESVAPFAAYCAAYGGVLRMHMEGWNHREVLPLNIHPQRLAALQERLLLFLYDKPHAHESRRPQSGQAQALLEGDGDLDPFGALLDDPPSTEPHYLSARRAGALGGTESIELGAGSLLLYTPPDKQDAVRAALQDLPELPFSFSAAGSRVAHHIET